MLNELNPDTIQELPAARTALLMALNRIDTLTHDLHALKEENQSLRDEINRLKGEQGKPDIKPKTAPAPPPPPDHSSEKERREPGKPWKKHAKIDRLVIHETKTLTLDPGTLPADAQFKGYAPVVVQDVVFRPHNTRFLKAVWYSPSAGQSYLAPLPPGYHGAFGPGIKALALTLYYRANVSEAKIRELFTDVGILISAGQLARFLIRDQAVFQQEKAALLHAGLQSSSGHHLDDTGTRVKGNNWYCQILCNAFYTVYHTTPGKSRRDVLAALLNGQAPSYRLNDLAFRLLAAAQLPDHLSVALRRLPQDQVLTEAQFNAEVTAVLPDLGSQHQRLIGDAAAIAAYQTQTAMPVIHTLLTDDAPQFKNITACHALCWVHDGRLYKKLIPGVPHFQRWLDHFLADYWDYYRELRAYQQQPTPAEAERLSQRFDTLFATVTGYDRLDDRIAKTKAKKAALLRVLDDPTVPLHNNPAELAARQRVRKRDVSLAAGSEIGIRAWDTMASLAETAHKLAVSFYAYVYDRVSGACRLPSLATLIAQKAQLPPVPVPILNSG